MSENPAISPHRKVAIVTGAARRIGAKIASRLHEAEYNIVVHYRHSDSEALQLVQSLNDIQPNTAIAHKAELADDIQVDAIVHAALDQWQRLDLLVNNASEFLPTPIGDIKSADLERLFSSNVFGALLIAQASAPSLELHGGSIINISDIYATKPNPEHTVYCAAKAALTMLTRSLAIELAPDVRVNSIAPGAILWPEEGPVPENSSTETLSQKQQNILESIPLKRLGSPDDIARAATFLASDHANYITGVTLTIDGGRSL